MNKEESTLCVIDGSDDVIQMVIPSVYGILVTPLDQVQAEAVKALRDRVEKSLRKNQEMLEKEIQKGREMCARFAQYYVENKKSTPDEAREFRETMELWHLLQQRIAALGHILFLLDNLSHA